MYISQFIVMFACYDSCVDKQIEETLIYVTFCMIRADFEWALNYQPPFEMEISLNLKRIHCRDLFSVFLSCYVQTDFISFSAQILVHKFISVSPCYLSVQTKPMNFCEMILKILFLLPRCFFHGISVI